MAKCIRGAPFQFRVRVDRYKVRINKLSRARRRLCVMINLSPSAKLSSSQQAEALQFQAYCIICNEFATSAGKSLPMFVSSVNNFSWANLCFPLKGEVLSLGGWWKAFKPFCFEHQTACLKICSQSEKWRARSEGKESEREILTQGVGKVSGEWF